MFYLKKPQTKHRGLNNLLHLWCKVQEVVSVYLYTRVVLGKLCALPFVAEIPVALRLIC